MGVLEGYDGLELPYRALNEECLRWYDHWLKDIDTGIMDEPPYKMTVINSGTRYEHEWPLARTQWKKLYLRSFGRLRWDSEPDSNLPPNSFVHLPPSISTEVNKIAYKTSRFTQPKEFTGLIELHLFASIDTTDANFVIKLYDVLPDGTRMPLLRYGALKASHPLDAENSTIGCPVHDNSISIPVTAGEVREYVIEISPHRHGDPRRSLAGAGDHQYVPQRVSHPELDRQGGQYERDPQQHHHLLQDLP